MNNNEEKLSVIRQKIDSLDIQIQELINQRAACADEVARIKESEGVERAIFYRPEREAQVLRMVKARNKGPLAAEEMARRSEEHTSELQSHYSN